jgi:hypothetical protein
VSALLVVTGGTGYWAWQEGMLERFGLPLGEEPTLEAGQGQAQGLEQLAALVDSAGGPAVIDSTATQVPDTSQAAPPEDEESPPPEPKPTPPPRTTTSQTTQRRPPVREPAPRPRFGAISINVLGNYGTVYVDEARIKGTPLIDHRVLAGTHVVRITNPRCRDWVDTVRVAVNETYRATVTLNCGG